MPFTFQDQMAEDAESQISLSEWGESAVYIDPLGVDTNIVIVCQGEQLVDRLTQSGKEQVRQNLFSIKAIEVPNPLVNAKIIYKNESWPMVGIASRDSVVCMVICELPTQSGRTGGSYTARINSFSYRQQG